ncbi:D-alanyl-D-alanine carboxypeptidase family protein [Candidatus Nucleicultrix amoebiphila]|uniref:serine-type D-Ala-D-Ala carboxypeptidase n=1 Tax=Candidatus Nucleicultrix amoebiphila FS5 TaxID=1414854 RepID=A0A1W6N363_9PROT|nr:D-alanyl-D-alanine carboxypeptidase family protein [Candidatus Nucleicultrix amoebiphila]ARN84285.1 hypothetical protein GQ61_01845 [Candidatus Nucleicultrix amoebiphila FS5]
MRRFILKIVLSFFLGLGSSVQALDLHSNQAILIDMMTNTVLFEKNSDQKVYPSSMTKMMTVYLAFEDLKAGRLDPEQTFVISKEAWKKEGSKTFIDVGSSVRVIDLLRGVIVQSGNDAAIALAEGIGGTEASFAERMTKKAHDLGAVNTTFKNASGWPDPEHLSTVRDLAIIAESTIRDFPEYYKLYGEREFTYNNIHQMNRNPLLYANYGADGLKTGHTDLGGYGVAASTVQDGRRLVLVINGAPGVKERAEDAKALAQWGYTYFATPLLYKVGDVVEKADVWMGTEPTVAVTVTENLHVTLPRQSLKDLKVEVTYKNPIPAPIKIGETVGKILISAPGLEPREVELVAAHAVDRAGFLKRIRDSFYYLLWGHN